MEAKNFNQKTITEVKTSEGSKITGSKQILQEIKNFYQALYQSEYAGSHRPLQKRERTGKEYGCYPFV